mmetsp:Transcript_10719/g.27505  ORF Transcript_10719/g.27505 Transcript_10719/m.27505 type:complete len:214 (+) Transcript_10719:1578-2219(+)
MESAEAHPQLEESTPHEHVVHRESRHEQNACHHFEEGNDCIPCDGEAVPDDRKVAVEEIVRQLYDRHVHAEDHVAQVCDDQNPGDAHHALVSGEPPANVMVHYHASHQAREIGTQQASVQVVEWLIIHGDGGPHCENQQKARHEAHHVQPEAAREGIDAEGDVRVGLTWHKCRWFRHRLMHRRYWRCRATVGLQLLKDGKRLLLLLAQLGLKL